MHAEVRLVLSAAAAAAVVVAVLPAAKVSRFNEAWSPQAPRTL
jgi:hypothetical protein